MLVEGCVYTARRWVLKATAAWTCTQARPWSGGVIRAGPRGEAKASYEAAVDTMLNPGVLPSNGARVEFLATPLFHRDGALVATPVFVALSTCRRNGDAGG
ncbi:hypothetical protein [Streptomyces gardneri]|uniref:Uncharacterized protein n=1 Tax=Streptomyces gardneri TaxID=66892 RepID=A0A4Y3RCV4_9ACTN|nr:hypothetical protein [Streptomyces gardneri]GEB55512.1 hypothetical protein SGA01_11170 [Streptomyces gardneri]GHH10581.1 hypothetical protein GCM10017674_55180 [Streptomyces gardneri]